VTIQCCGVGNNDLVAFLQPFKDLDLADGVAPEFHTAALRFRAVGTKDKHPDGLLRLSEGGSTDFQDVFESLQLDRSVHAQVRTCTWRQRTNQRSINLKRAFASGRVDTRNCSLDQTVASVDDDWLADAYAGNLRFRDSQNGLQRGWIGNACDVCSGRHLLALSHEHLLEHAAASGSHFQLIN